MNKKSTLDQLPLMSERYIDSKYIGKEIQFIEISLENQKKYNSGNVWKTKDGLKPSYAELVGKKGILNWIKEGAYNLVIYKITLEDGIELFREIYTKFNIMSDNSDIESELLNLVVLNELNILKKNYINKIIWLNQEYGYLKELPYVRNKANNQEYFENKKGLEVVVEDIIPFSIMYGEEINYYFIISSENGQEKAYFRYSPSLENSQFFEHNPFLGMSNDMIESIRKGKVKIGMTKEQVIHILGYPDQINKTVNQYVTSEQWVYNTSDYKSDYLYFEDGILNTIQEF